jgi:hypothetical protein
MCRGRSVLWDNRHYMVPEFSRGQTFTPASTKPLDEFLEVLAPPHASPDELQQLRDLGARLF